MRRTKRSKNTGPDWFGGDGDMMLARAIVAEDQLESGNTPEPHPFGPRAQARARAWGQAQPTGGDTPVTDINVSVIWRNMEEKRMNLFAVVLVGAGKIVERQWRVALSPKDVLVELGREGVQPEQIVIVDHVASLSADNLAMYES